MKISVVSAGPLLISTQDDLSLGIKWDVSYNNAVICFLSAFVFFLLLLLIFRMYTVKEASVCISMNVSFLNHLNGDMKSVILSPCIAGKFQR